MHNQTRLAAWLAVVIIVTVIVGILVLGGRRLKSNAISGEEKVIQAEPNPMPPGEALPLSAPASNQTETATFALG